jgi:hypothetical protein
MPITYALDRSRNLIIETWTGTVHAADLAAHWRTYLADPAVMDCRRTLVDLREADLAFTGTELASLVEALVVPVLGERNWATALLVAAPSQFGKSRQYQVFAESYSTDAIFTAWDAAEAWLLGQNPDEVPPEDESAPA